MYHCIFTMDVYMCLPLHPYTQVVTVTENVKFSQSALSAAACFKRVSTYTYHMTYSGSEFQYKN